MDPLSKGVLRARGFEYILRIPLVAEQYSLFVFRFCSICVTLIYIHVCTARMKFNVTFWLKASANMSQLIFILSPAAAFFVLPHGMLARLGLFAGRWTVVLRTPGVCIRRTYRKVGREGASGGSLK